jgi:hypothetical protein
MIESYDPPRNSEAIRKRHHPIGNCKHILGGSTYPKLISSGDGTAYLLIPEAVPNPIAERDLRASNRSSDRTFPHALETGALEQSRNGPIIEDAHTLIH